MATASREKVAKRILRYGKADSAFIRHKRESGWNSSTAGGIGSYDSTTDATCPTAKHPKFIRKKISKGNRKLKRNPLSVKLSPVKKKASPRIVYHSIDRSEVAQENKQAGKLHERAVKYIKTREALLYQLNALLLCWPTAYGSPASPLKRADSLMPVMPITNVQDSKNMLFDLASKIQLAGIHCVEAIADWMLHVGQDSENPPCFIWNKENYLKKMYYDLDFVPDALTSVGVKNLRCFTKSNPILIDQDQNLGRAWAAHLIVVEVVERQKVVEALESETIEAREPECLPEEVGDLREEEPTAPAPECPPEDLVDLREETAPECLPEELQGLVDPRDAAMVLRLLSFIKQFDEKNSVYPHAYEFIQYLSSLPDDTVTKIIESVVKQHGDVSLYVLAQLGVTAINELLRPVVKATLQRLEEQNQEMALAEMDLQQVLKILADVYQEEAFQNDYVSGSFGYDKKMSLHLLVANVLLTQLHQIQGGIPDHTFHSQSLSRLLELFSPFILDAITRDSLDIDIIQEVESTLRLFSLKDSSFLLEPAHKKLLVSIDLVEKAGGIEKINIVCDRDSIVLNSLTQLSKLLNETSGKVYHIFPFFKSPHGKKIVNGTRVEEGEGHGPRKEWFTLIMQGLASKWLLGSMDASYPLHSIASCRLEAHGIGQRVKKGYRVRIVEKDSHIRNYTVSELAEQTMHVRTVVNSDVIETDKKFQHAVDPKKTCVIVDTPRVPILTYIKDSESYWISPNVQESSVAEKELRLLGAVIGSALVNHTTLNLNVNEILFKYILHGVPENESVESLKNDMKKIDLSVCESLDQVAKMNAREFEELLEAEGLSDQNPTEYIQSTLQERLSTSIRAPLESIRAGFSCVMSLNLLKRFCVTYVDFHQMVCGRTMNVNDDFDIRDTFAISADTEFKHSSNFQEMFWEIVDAFPPLDKRKFIEFVTGVSHLPLRNTEFFRIEMPFTATCAADHEKFLQRLPQAHTCDNVLELPNYYTAFVKTRASGREDLRPEEKLELKQLIESKLKDAMYGGQGYGLDALADAPDIINTSSEPQHAVLEESFEASMDIPTLDGEKKSDAETDYYEDDYSFEEETSNPVVPPRSETRESNYSDFSVERPASRVETRESSSYSEAPLRSETRESNYSDFSVEPAASPVDKEPRSETRESNFSIERPASRVESRSETRGSNYSEFSVEKPASPVYTADNSVEEPRSETRESNYSEFSVEKPASPVYTAVNSVEEPRSETRGSNYSDFSVEKPASPVDEEPRSETRESNYSEFSVERPESRVEPRSETRESHYSEFSAEKPASPVEEPRSETRESNYSEFSVERPESNYSEAPLRSGESNRPEDAKMKSDGAELLESVDFPTEEVPQYDYETTEEGGAYDYYEAQPEVNDYNYNATEQPNDYDYNGYDAAYETPQIDIPTHKGEDNPVSLDYSDGGFEDYSEDDFEA